MNILLLMASVGTRLENGKTLGAALRGAAVEHDTECAAWDRVATGTYSTERVGDYDVPPVSMAEFFATRPPPSRWNRVVHWLRTLK